MSQSYELRLSVAYDDDLSASEDEALSEFLVLSSADVEARAIRSLRGSPAGTTWLGLSKLMERQSYQLVRDLGLPAAGSWARHLGLIDHGAPPVSSPRENTQRAASDPPARAVWSGGCDEARA
jgi:hypothetical protein